MTVTVGASPVANTVVGTKERCVHCPSSRTDIEPEAPTFELMLVLMVLSSAAKDVAEGIGVEVIRIVLLSSSIAGVPVRIVVEVALLLGVLEATASVDAVIDEETSEASDGAALNGVDSAFAASLDAADANSEDSTSSNVGWEVGATPGIVELWMKEKVVRMKLSSDAAGTDG